MCFHPLVFEQQVEKDVHFFSFLWTFMASNIPLWSVFDIYDFKDSCHQLYSAWEGLKNGTVESDWRQSKVLIKMSISEASPTVQDLRGAVAVQCVGDAWCQCVGSNIVKKLSYSSTGIGRCVLARSTNLGHFVQKIKIEKSWLLNLSLRLDALECNFWPICQDNLQISTSFLATLHIIFKALARPSNDPKTFFAHYRFEPARCVLQMDCPKWE